MKDMKKDKKKKIDLRILSPSLFSFSFFVFSPPPPGGSRIISEATKFYLLCLSVSSFGRIFDPPLLSFVWYLV